MLLYCIQYSTGIQGLFEVNMAQLQQSITRSLRYHCTAVQSYVTYNNRSTVLQVKAIFAVQYEIPG